MRILIEKNDGFFIEIKEIENISDTSRVLIFFTQNTLSTSDLIDLERELSRKIGSKCIVLPSYINKVIGV